MKHNIDYTLYLVTDRALMSAPTLELAVEAAIRGGCTVVQLREKQADSRAFFALARGVKNVADAYGVPLIIDDRIDIALAVDAAGVHVGQSDVPAAVARSLIGSQKLLGVSVANVAEARAAAQAGADYLGVGAMFATSTKADTRPVEIAQLREIRAAVELPLVAIGGINAATLPALRGCGLNGIAVISAVLGAPDIERAARELRAACAREGVVRS